MNQRWLTTDPVVVTRTNQGWEFRPSLLRADATFTLFIAVAVGSLGLAGYLLWVGRSRRNGQHGRFCSGRGLLAGGSVPATPAYPAHRRKHRPRLLLISCSTLLHSSQYRTGGAHSGQRQTAEAH
jgi:hypothetical protein